MEIFHFSILWFILRTERIVSHSLFRKPNVGFTQENSRIFEHSFKRYFKNSGKKSSILNIEKFTNKVR